MFQKPESTQALNNNLTWSQNSSIILDIYHHSTLLLSNHHNMEFVCGMSQFSPQVITVKCSLPVKNKVLKRLHHSTNTANRHQIISTKPTLALSCVMAYSKNSFRSDVNCCGTTDLPLLMVVDRSSIAPASCVAFSFDSRFSSPNENPPNLHKRYRRIFAVAVSLYTPTLEISKM